MVTYPTGPFSSKNFLDVTAKPSSLRIYPSDFARPAVEVETLTPLRHIKYPGDGRMTECSRVNAQLRPDPSSSPCQFLQVSPPDDGGTRRGTTLENALPYSFCSVLRNRRFVRDTVQARFRALRSRFPCSQRTSNGSAAPRSFVPASPRILNDVTRILFRSQRYEPTEKPRIKLGY